MHGKRLIEKIRLRNILSFGDKGEEITLDPLNIIVGQNASGKSNFIQIIKLLEYAAKGRLADFIRNSGGIDEYLWKGSSGFPSAEISLSLSAAKTRADSVEYTLKFTKSGPYFELIEEEVTPAKPLDDDDFYYRNKNGHIEIVRQGKNGDGTENGTNRERQIIDRKDINPEMSVLSQFGDPLNYQVINDISDLFSDIRIFEDWKFSFNRPPRKPVETNNPGDFLSENGENLALVLSSFEHNVRLHAKVVNYLKKFYERLENVRTIPQTGTEQIYFQETGLEKLISAYRFSDGTLRYLCLLVILCHPEPPPLICIEEPETGLHPDILPAIAELMKEASQRTQLIVTTHSDILVSAFSETPEAIMVCEKDANGTHFKRLEADKLKIWLEEYTLGEAWLRGAVGGTRW
jgi:predicted ATPase